MRSARREYVFERQTEEEGQEKRDEAAADSERKPRLADSKSTLLPLYNSFNRD